MNPTAYIETSVVSYLTARPSRDVVVAAYQEVTRAWWRDAATRFELVASALVIAEARVGDVDAARARLEALKDVAFLDATLDAEQLTQTLLEFGGRFHAKLQATQRTCHCCHERCRLSSDVELPTYCQRCHARQD